MVDGSDEVLVADVASGDLCPEPIRACRSSRQDFQRSVLLDHSLEVISVAHPIHAAACPAADLGEYLPSVGDDCSRS
jgi:hypothetical protein